MDRKTEQVDAIFPPLINGKTRQELAESIAASDKANFMHFVDGVKFPPQVRPSTLQALKTFQVREDDVYLFTFPRSGMPLMHSLACRMLFVHWVLLLVE